MELKAQGPVWARARVLVRARVRGAGAGEDVGGCGRIGRVASEPGGGALPGMRITWPLLTFFGTWYAVVARKDVEGILVAEMALGDERQRFAGPHGVGEGLAPQGGLRIDRDLPHQAQCQLVVGIELERTLQLGLGLVFVTVFQQLNRLHGGLLCLRLLGRVGAGAEAGGVAAARVAAPAVRAPVG